MYIYIYIYICIYIYIYDTCAWTPNKDSRTYQLGSLCNRYPVSGYLLRIQVWSYLGLSLRLPEATSDNGKSWESDL